MVSDHRDKFALMSHCLQANSWSMNMSTITAEPKQSVFSRLTDVTEIRDAKGNVLGVYTPTGKSQASACKHMLILFEDGATVTFDMERAKETLAREKGRGRPFREIIQSLEERARKPA